MDVCDALYSVCTMLCRFLVRISDMVPWQFKLTLCAAATVLLFFPLLLLPLFWHMPAPVENYSGRLPWRKQMHFIYGSKSFLLASAWTAWLWGQLSTSAERDGEAALKLCQLKSAWNYCRTAPCEWGYSGWSYMRQLSTSNSSAAEWGKFCSPFLSHPTGSSAFSVCQLWFSLDPFSELLQLAKPAESYVGAILCFGFRWIIFLPR